MQTGWEEPPATPGEWLRRRRTALGLSQEQAAERAGLTRVMWAKLEGGASGTRRQNIPRIADALQSDPDEVYQVFGYAPPGLLPETAREVADYADEIGRRIRRQRAVLGMTQEEVAGQLGIPRGTYSTYEVGRVPLPPHLTAPLARILQLPPGYLVGEDIAEANYYSAAQAAGGAWVADPAALLAQMDAKLDRLLVLVERAG